MRVAGGLRELDAARETLFDSDEGVGERVAKKLQTILLDKHDRTLFRSVDVIEAEALDKTTREIADEFGKKIDMLIALLDGQLGESDSLCCRSFPYNL